MTPAAPKQPPRVPRSIRLMARLDQQLVEVFDREGWSFSYGVERALEEWAKDREGSP